MVEYSPSVREIAAQFPVESYQKLEIGNPATQLESETDETRGLSIRVGYAKQIPKLKWGH